MKDIKQLLKKIESKREIKILYVCETGSSAWDFPSPDSVFSIWVFGYLIPGKPG